MIQEIRDKQKESGVEKRSSYLELRLLELANGRRTQDQLCSLVCVECNIDKLLFRKDMARYIENLERQALVTYDQETQLLKKKELAVERFLEINGYPSPVIVFWDITNVCNLKCVHCYARANEASERELTTEEALRLIDRLEVMNPYMVEFSGGEPILRRDIVRLLEHARQKLSSKLKLLTNGIAISPDICCRLKGLVDFVHVSIDGLEDTHDQFRGMRGAFKKAQRALACLRENDIPFGVCMTVHKKSAPQIERIVEMALQSGAQRMRFFFIVPLGRGQSAFQDYYMTLEERRQAYEIIIDLKRKFQSRLPIDARDGMYGNMRLDIEKMYDPDECFIHCRAATRLLHIDVEGNIFPCSMLINDKRFAAGNVKVDDVVQVWRNPDTFSEFRKMTIKDIEGCGTCEKRQGCGGGMRCISYALKGSLFKVDPECIYYGD